MAIDCVNKQRLVKIDRRRVEQIAQAALETIENRSQTGGGLTVAFVRDREIRRLNREYRGKDHATDVLSFQTGSEENSVAFREFDYLGDIVISTDTALRQANQACIPFEREVEELVIHGVLHLCGYDHETDNGEMNRLELKLRKRLLERL